MLWRIRRDPYHIYPKARDSAAVRKWGGEQLQEIAAELEQTKYWTDEAAMLLVPLPDKGDVGMWEGNRLTTKGVFTVRNLVRRERRDRWESFQIRIALALSVLTFVMGVLNAHHSL